MIGVREFLMIVVESAFGVTKASPVAGTDSTYVRLDEGNAYTMEPVPVTVDIMAGNGRTLKGDTVSDKTELKGQLKIKLCYSQAHIVLALGMIQVDGATAPWATTEPVGDFASVSVYHAVYQDDTGTFSRTKVAGVKSTGGKLEVSEESQVMTLTLDLQGSKHTPNDTGDSTAISTTEFPTPAESAYATDYVQFSHSDGGLTLNSVRGQYWTLSHSWTNKTEVSYFTGRYAKRIRSYGRDVSLDTEILLVGTPNDLTTFRTVAAMTASLVFTNTVNTITFNYQSNSRIKSLPHDLAPDKAFRRKFSLENRLDKTAGIDFALTVA